MAKMQTISLALVLALSVLPAHSQTFNNPSGGFGGAPQPTVIHPMITTSEFEPAPIIQPEYVTPHNFFWQKRKKPEIKLRTFKEEYAFVGPGNKQTIVLIAEKPSFREDHPVKYWLSRGVLWSAETAGAMVGSAFIARALIGHI